MRYQGSYPAKDYLEAHSKVKPSLLAIVRRLSTHGTIEVSERGHMLKGKYKDIMELKPGKHRVYGFRHNNNFYLTNGAPKKKAKEQEADFKLALAMRTDFYAKLN
jgi:hypothetical protein